MLSIYRVTGNSMLPQVKNGDYMLLFTWGIIAPQPGFMVIFDHLDYGALLKKVISTNPEKNTFSAQGMNSSSIQATQLQNIHFTCLRGIVIWQFKC